MIPMMLMMMSPMAAPKAVDEKLANGFRHILLETVFKRNPTFATAMGHHDFDDQMDDLGMIARSDTYVVISVMSEALLNGINPSALSEAGKIDAKIWSNWLQMMTWQRQNDDRFTYDPRIYGEYHTDSVYTLFTQSTLPRERNVSNAAKRIAQIPRVLSAAKNSLENPPRILTEIAIKRTQGSIAFYEKEIYSLSGENPATSELREPCKEAVKALKEFADWLEKDLLPKSNGTWRLGKERFAKKLEMELNAGLTAEEVIKEADAEVDRVEKEMYVIAKQLWFKYFPNQALPADDPEGRRRVVANVLEKIGEDRSTPESMLADAKKGAEDIKTFIREKRILTLPEPDRCQIIEMPEFKRGFSAAYLENAPPLDAKANSYYAISPPPSDWTADRKATFFKEYNRAMLQILTIHEAYPGHYVQLEYANRNPSLIRKVLSSGVYIEGWAVYTEQMMLDQGYGNGDPALRLQQLKFYLRAVLNAILDHRMHCNDMTDEEALKLLMGRGFQTEAEAVAKVARAKQSSCQLSTYFVGRTAFYRLRQKVQRTHGDKFDLLKFHEAVLNEGSVPVKYLPELVK